MEEYLQNGGMSIVMSRQFTSRWELVNFLCALASGKGQWHTFTDTHGLYRPLRPEILTIECPAGTTYVRFGEDGWEETIRNQIVLVESVSSFTPATMFVTGSLL